MTEPIRRRPKTPFTLSPTSTLGPFLSIGGIIAEDDQQAFLGGDITAQADRVLDTLDARLRDLNAAIEDVVSVSVYLKRHEDFAAMNDVYRRFWPVNAPCRTTIMAGLRHPDALIEITAVVVPRGMQRDIIHRTHGGRRPILTAMPFAAGAPCSCQGWCRAARSTAR